jgi:hypothetical protein
MADICSAESNQRIGVWEVAQMNIELLALIPLAFEIRGSGRFG